MSFLISETGVINGRGCDKYKWVSNLTKEERELVKNGGLVLIPDNNSHRATTPFKKVTYYNGRYSHKNFYGDVHMYKGVAQ